MKKSLLDRLLSNIFLPGNSYYPTKHAKKMKQQSYHVVHVSQRLSLEDKNATELVGVTYKRKNKKLYSRRDYRRMFGKRAAYN